MHGTDSPGLRFNTGGAEAGRVDSHAASTFGGRAANVRAPETDGGVVMAETESGRGKTDAVSVLYIAGGIPAIVGFLVLLFAIGVRYCGLPA